MKKILIMLISVMMVASLAACGGGGGNKSGGSAAQTGSSGDTKQEGTSKLADITQVGKMTFKQPDHFESVELFTDQDSAGEVAEDDVTFVYPDGTELIYVCGKGIKATEYISVDGAETKEINGTTFYLQNIGGRRLALAEVGDDLYIVGSTLPENGDTAVLDGAMEQIGFEGSGEMMGQDPEIEGITYTLNSDWNLAGNNVSQKETPDGTLKEKRTTLRFADSEGNVSFRFRVQVNKNTNVQELMDSSKEAVEMEIGGNKYLVYSEMVADGSFPYRVFAQVGEDAYVISNAGSESSLFSTRSEESQAAFEEFLNTVSFTSK